MKNKSLRMLFIAVAAAAVCGSGIFAGSKLLSNNEKNKDKTIANEVMIDDMASNKNDNSEADLSDDTGVYTIDANGVYIFNNFNEKYKNEDLTVDVANANITDGKLSIEYTLRLDKVNDIEAYEECTDFSNGDMDSYEQFSEDYMNYYKKLGYDKYFDINENADDLDMIISSTHSKIQVGDKELKAEKSESHMASTIIGDYVDVIETYDLASVDMNGSDSLKLVLSDMEVPLKFQAFNDFMQNLDNSVVKSTDENIVTMCQTSFDAYIEHFFIDLTTLENGDYGKVVNYEVSVFADGEELICSANPAYYTDDISYRPKHYVVDMEDIDEISDLTVCVNGIYIEGPDNEIIKFDISGNDYGAIAVPENVSFRNGSLKLDSAEVVDFNTAVNRWNMGYLIEDGIDEGWMGDGIDISFTDDKSDGYEFQGFSNAYINDQPDNKVDATVCTSWDPETDIITFGNHCGAFLLTDKENVQNVTFADAFYFLKSDMVFKIK